MSSDENTTEVVYETYDAFVKSEQDYFLIDRGGRPFTHAELLGWHLGLFGEKHVEIVGPFIRLFFAALPI